MEKQDRKSLVEMDGTELHNLMVDLRLLQDRVGKIGASTSSRLQSVQTEIRNRAIVKGEEPKLVVSDHAIVRYLERVKGFDRKALEAEIALNAANGTPLFDEYPSVVEHDGYVYVCRHNDFIVTVLDKNLLDPTRPIVID